MQSLRYLDPSSDFSLEADQEGKRRVPKESFPVFKQLSPEVTDMGTSHMAQI